MCARATLLALAAAALGACARDKPADAPHTLPPVTASANATSPVAPPPVRPQPKVSGDAHDPSLERLAPFKVPRRILVLPEIPKGPTGKVQRIGLAQKLGLASS